VVNRLVSGTLEGLPGLYDGIVTWGLGLVANSDGSMAPYTGQLNQEVHVTVGDLSEAIAFTVVTHPVHANKLSHQQQQDLRVAVQEHLAGPGAADATEIDGIATGLRKIIGLANEDRYDAVFVSVNSKPLPLTEAHNIANVLAKIILQSSKSYATGDIIVAIEAVFRALELGQFSRLPGIYDAIAKASLGTIYDWQHRLTITADDIAHELRQLLSLKLAEIILKRSKSHAMGDLVVATEAVLGALERGELSGLAGTYDAIEQARPGTIVHGQQQSTMTADELARTLNLQIGAELNHALAENRTLKNPFAVARALQGAVEAVTRSSRADLPREVNVATISAPSLDPSAAFTDFLASHIVEQLLNTTRDSSGRLQILRLQNTPAVIRIIQEVLSDVGAGTHGLIDREALRSFAIKLQLATKGKILNQAIMIDADNLS
ncbi:MAG: hypothetical protein ORN21_03155, partial [Methylophilaceae bacterium]|nr:hypothetical protein [Methylophilaceae bacterium]